MENASKALLIAGSVLVVIVLIAVGMKILNSTAGASESAQKTMDSTAITNFNMQFVNKGVSLTSKVTVTGSQALALQQAVLASNAVNKTHQISGNVTSTNIVISNKYYIHKPGTKDGYKKCHKNRRLLWRMQ